MEGAFSQLQARLSANAEDSNTLATPADSAKEVVVLEELQKLSDLHVRLCSVLQEQRDLDVEENMTKASFETNCMQKYDVCGTEEKRPILRSYEGIISRFYEEMRKKDTVTEALKEMLAKSMLRGEKLERRIKFLEDKLK